MGFRRSSSEEPGSSRWRRKHRSRLLACGLPAAVLDSDRKLTYLLLHGDDELETGWDTSFLSDEQAQQLLALLKELIPNPVGFDLTRYSSEARQPCEASPLSNRLMAGR
jgi:hypothetical protein